MLPPDDHTQSSRHQQTVEIPSLLKIADRAAIVLSMATCKAEDLEWIVTHLSSRRKSRQSLVEFPGVLLPSFHHTLLALQKMSRTLDLPLRGHNCTRHS